MVFIDGQNLFHAARDAFGYKHPNYDPYELACSICKKHNWSFVADDRLPRVHFYTGLPSHRDNEYWNLYWRSKLAVLGRRKGEIRVTTRPVRYSQQMVKLLDGTRQLALVGQEKGIDLRIGHDAARYAMDRKYDVAVLLSQDQDLCETVQEIKLISQRQKRWIKVVSAYPVGLGTTNRRGINGTDWIPIPKELYDLSLDAHDHRPA